MSRYPLLFTFRDAISGNGFLAGVTLTGRALMVHEEDAWWVYGVRHGALAETGQTPEETYLRFRDRYKAVLFDIAGECADFEAFRREVERFFYEPDEEEEGHWVAAVEALRLGGIVPEPPFSALPKEPAESRPSQVTVERLEPTSRFTASDNVPDVFTAAA